MLEQRYLFSWWHWPNQADFSYGYDIRNETIFLQLPELHPILHTGEDVEDLCGDFLYEFNDPLSESSGVQVTLASDLHGVFDYYLPNRADEFIV